MEPAGLSPDGFIRLRPSNSSVYNNTFFISYRTANGCDEQLDPVYLDKVSCGLIPTMSVLWPNLIPEPDHHLLLIIILMLLYFPAGLGPHLQRGSRGGVPQWAPYLPHGPHI